MMNPILYTGLKKESQIRYQNKLQYPIIRCVCKYYNLSLRQIESRSRVQRFVECRIMIASHLKENTSLTLKEIGVLMGGRDHTSILYYIDQYNDRHSLENNFRKKSKEIKSLIKKAISD